MNSIHDKQNIGRRINIALAGIGNCASALIQGLHYYAVSPDTDRITPGIAFPSLGSYQINDITTVAAFDINKNKVGLDLSQAIFSAPNSISPFTQMPSLGVTVQRGPVLDGLGINLRGCIPVDYDAIEVDVVQVLRETKTDLLINLLPTGSRQASAFYAEACLKAGCGFINAIPEVIATDSTWQGRFRAANLPLLGDDLKSQLGATIVHRLLIDLFVKRGVTLNNTFQLNAGGNTDFLNLAEPGRAASKIQTKTTALQNLIPYPTDIHVGVGNFVPFLGDRKRCFIHLEGSIFAGVPVNIDVQLAVDDSHNAGGVLVDLIRLAQLCVDVNRVNALSELCSYYFKSPPEPCSDDEAYRRVMDFLQTELS